MIILWEWHILHWTNFSIAIHGGAGTLVKGLMTSQLEDQYKTALDLALEAGYSVLENGGNAFDAAVAVSAVLAVVEPYSSGMGGGGFWLLHRAKDGRQTMLDGREVAPSSASKNMYLDKNGDVIKRK